MSSLQHGQHWGLWVLYIFPLTETVHPNPGLLSYKLTTEVTLPLGGWGGVGQGNPYTITCSQGGLVSCTVWSVVL